MGFNPPPLCAPGDSGLTGEALFSGVILALHEIPSGSSLRVGAFDHSSES